MEDFTVIKKTELQTNYFCTFVLYIYYKMLCSKFQFKGKESYKFNFKTYKIFPGQNLEICRE